MQKETAVKILNDILKHLGMSVKQFSDSLGKERPQWAYDVLNPEKKVGISKNIADLIIEHYPQFNKSWLLTGEGEMLSKDGASEGKADRKPATRYYPNVTGTMGSVEFLENPDETWLPISVPGFERCEFAIPAYGDSMTPTITSGHIILLSPWRESYLEWGKIYLVVTRQGHRSVKRLFPADTDDSVTCKSDNPAYPPYQVRREDITRLYLVQGWICRDSI